MIRPAGTLPFALVILMVFATQTDYAMQAPQLDEPNSPSSTTPAYTAAGLATFSDWSQSSVIVPNGGSRFNSVVGSSIIGVYTGTSSTPDGQASSEPRLSIIRDDGENFTWYSEEVEFRRSATYGRWIQTHVLSNGSILVAAVLCNENSPVSEHEYSTNFDDPICYGIDGQESDGALVRIFGVSPIENETIDLGTITYSACGREPTSGGGSGGWNYRLFTPKLEKIAIHGNFSDFQVGLSHRHTAYDSTASNSAGWPSSNTAKCKIEFNGTELDQLPGSTDIAVDEISVSPTMTALERHASSLVDLEFLSFGVNSTMMWLGRQNGASRTFNCEFPSGTSTLGTFTELKDVQSGARLIPGLHSTSQGTNLALLDTSTCAIVATFVENSVLYSNTWTDLTGITHVIGKNVGGSSTSFFNSTIHVGSTWVASFHTNASLAAFSNVILCASCSAASYSGSQGFESVSAHANNPPLIYARDTDYDDVIDARDAFPLDPTESEDSDHDGYGDNADECPTQWGNSTVDRYGCSDGDGDGVSDLTDAFVAEKTQWSDQDADGFGDNQSGFRGDTCPTDFGTSTRNNTFGCPDADYDGWADSQDFLPNDASQWKDSDGDGFGNSIIGFEGDACPETAGNSTVDRFGCIDADGDGTSDKNDAFPTNPTQQDDRDGDGYGDNQSSSATLVDAFPSDTTQWNDTDGDGHGDNPFGNQGDWFPNDPTRWQDSDRDGVADEDDAFPNDASQSSDSDGDGFGDDPNGSRSDAFPDDPLEWADPDGDGYGSNVDAFPNDGSQWNDTDGDGHGDNPFGSQGDWFPNDPTRWQDSDRDGVADEDDAFDNDATQWNDTDGDGHGDNPSGTAADRFPNDPSRWQDSDHDGVADEDDAFPDDATQNADTDGDGYGDDVDGNRGDAFPADPSEWADTDADGVGNNADAFPFDPSQTSDSDGDGFGDDPRGSGADRFPDDATQWSDIDGDGYGDNAEGNNPDAFIADPTQWADVDGDGYGDNPTGRQADAFPNDPTQWEDQDGDGLGDNQSGNAPDPYLFDFDNDGYNDSIDPLPKLASPGDLDNDGTPDEEDAFPEDFREWADSDGDGEGDNADPDDDNDGWPDTDELRQGTDPYSSSSQPVDTFEIVIPGTQVGLGAWDLIGMFGGIPLFFWIMFGFVTRNSRTARFEGELRAAQSRDELEKVALRWEYMLMLRMLGPHQGIRLERLRAELDDRFESQGQHLAHLDQHEADQTNLVVEQMQAEEEAAAAATSSAAEKSVVEIPSGAPAGEAPAVDTPPTQVADGYEWLDHAGQKWYRTEGSGAEWTRFVEVES